MSYLYYADRVNQLPLGVVGVAIGVVLLPLLTRQLRGGEAEAARDSQNRAIEFALMLSAPATAALIVAPDAIVTVLFQRGEFDAAAAAATAAALRAFAVGLPAYVLIKSLTPGYFARQDTRTPVKIAVVAVALNIVLALILMRFMAHAGIALATALAAWLNAIVLGVVLLRRGHLSFDARLRRRAPRIVAAAALMGAVVFWGTEWLAAPLAGTEGSRVVALAALVAVGLVAFALLARILGAFRLDDVKAAFSKT